MAFILLEWLSNYNILINVCNVIYVYFVYASQGIKINQGNKTSQNQVKVSQEVLKHGMYFQ